MDCVLVRGECYVLVKGLELLIVNDDRFMTEKPLFSDYKALVADSEEKLCRIVSE